MNNDFNTKERIDELIVKFWGKEITPEEEDYLRAWISESKENRRHFIAMQYLWNNTGAKDKNDYDSDDAFKYFKDRIGKKMPGKHPRIINIYTILRYAAIIIMAFALGRLSFFLVNNHNLNNSKQFAIKVPDGSKTKIVLPDKSIIWLNSGSTLSYSKNFGQKNRKVKLSGEGYFEVTHNAEKPFSVETKQATIKDLGTKFDVNAYSEDKHLVVTLLSGSILLKTIYAPGKPLLLKPNQSAVIDKDLANVSVKKVIASEATAWTKGEIIFDEVPFENIVRRLEREYNVRIVVKNPKLNSLHFFGTFKQSQTIQDVLKTMTDNNEFHYKMKDNLITIY